MRQVRTSTGMFFEPAADEVIARIEERVALVTMLPKGGVISWFHAYSALTSAWLLFYICYRSSNIRVIQVSSVLISGCSDVKCSVLVGVAIYRPMHVVGIGSKLTPVNN